MLDLIELGQEELHIEDTVQRYEEKVASRC